MALNFVKGPPAQQTQAKAQPKPASGAPWFKTGKEAKAAVEEADRRTEEKREASSRTWRFYMKEAEEARLTFVDGELDADGLLSNPVFKEHNLMQNGKYGNYYICTSDSEPCPICEGGDEPSLVQAFTIIDHREVKSKDQTKTYSNMRRLFVAKRNVMKLLQAKGGKQGGLVGCTFDVLRTSANAANTGDSFDFVEKNSVDELRAFFTKDNDKGVKETYFLPVAYGEEFNYHDAKELRKMGFGVGSPVGTESVKAGITAGGKPSAFAGKM
jgi:hypothetical protein